jgi:hypothetical protein
MVGELLAMEKVVSLPCWTHLCVDVFIIKAFGQFPFVKYFRFLTRDFIQRPNNTLPTRFGRAVRLHILHRLRAHAGGLRTPYN